MDRSIQYPGAIPLETDPLGIQVNTMVAIGYALRAAFGPGPWVDGLSCTATTPASMQVQVGTGSIIALGVVDATAYSSIPASSDALVKMGINRQVTTLTPLTAPAITGQSQNFLIEAAFSEVDAGPLALPYFNASNPTISFSGPNNSGTPQNTKRTQTVALQVLPGVPAATGSQTTPPTTIGWVPLSVITLNAGQTTITNSNIVAAAASPFIGYKIPDIVGLPQLRGLANRRPLKIYTTIAGATASGTYTVPATVAWIKFRAVAGGGGGGAASNSPSVLGGGGGGGGGGYCEGWLAVTPGQTFAYSVGAGGAYGGSPNLQGGTGVSTSFGSVFSVTGGMGGFGPNAGTNATSGGGGGTGVAPGYLVINGGSGNDGGHDTTSASGIGGSTLLGPGERANIAYSSGGVGGNQYGGGGGGSYYNAGTGGNGGGGIIIIEEYCL